MKNKNVVFVAGLHGDEQVPLFALASYNIPVLAGNPRALMLKKRFIDYDLNACFGLEGKGYEFSRAKELLKIIPEDSLVVDFHTTSADTEPFAIVVEEKMLEFAKYLGLSKIIIMRMNIKKGHALINYRRGVSIEVGKHDTKQAFEQALRIVKNLRAGKKRRIEIYEVYDIIKKKGEYKNFKKHKDGFYPVLAGEKAYPFFGLKAKRVS